MIRIGFPDIHLPFAESNNRSAADLLEKGALSEGTAILTYEQRQGRGQFDRKWHMDPGKDLAVSYYLRPPSEELDLFSLNKCIALALKSCIDNIGLVQSQIKWPNDLWLGGRKLAGILIEPSWQGSQCKHVIVGIGINANGAHIKQENYQGISLKEASGRRVDLSELFAKLSYELSLQYALYLKGNHVQIQRAYDQSLLYINRRVSFIHLGKAQSGEVLGTDRHGQIMLKLEHGVKHFKHGEIQIDHQSL